MSDLSTLSDAQLVLVATLSLKKATAELERHRALVVDLQDNARLQDEGRRTFTLSEILSAHGFGDGA